MRAVVALAVVALGGGACSSSSSTPTGTGGHGGSAATGGAGGSAAGGAAGISATGGSAVGGRSAAGGSAGGGSASGGAGGSASGGAGGSPTDPMCPTILAPIKAPPYPTELRFKNAGAAPLYLHTGCIGVDYGISSCASGYRDAVQPVFHCACSCDNMSCTGGVACGACPADAAATVDPGKSVSVSWDAIQITEEARSTYTCVRSQPVPPGSYRVAVRVYADAATATKASGGRLVTQDFLLPASGGILEIPIDAVQPDPCTGAATTTIATTPACTGAEVHDTACSLGFSMTYGAEGGLSAWTDSAALAPPASYTLTRAYLNSTMANRQCAASIPMCTRDARVITTSDLTRVLTNPTVAGAFGAAMPIVGRDPRPNDGQILVLRMPGGKSLGIGDSVPPDKVVPPAIVDAAATLRRLDQQMKTDPACASLAQP